MIFNLLKNAIYYIRDANKGKIYIWAEHDVNFNILHVKDTGKGISASILPNIFNQFFTNTPHGAGIGLTFCKMVMERFGGDIICYSKKGEYADFILYFPRKNG